MSIWKQLCQDALWNTLDLCFDEIHTEPQRILVIGGGRQIDFAQRLALLLPAADITLLDSDDSVTQAAREQICCRFKFVTSSLDALPYENGHFDWTIAQNALALPHDNWQAMMTELARVTQKNLLFSMHRPVIWSSLRWLPGLKQAVSGLGLFPPERLPDDPASILNRLLPYGKLKSRFEPFLWQVTMWSIHQDTETCLILGKSEKPILAPV